jgi:hypothetical protein
MIILILTIQLIINRIYELEPESKYYFIKLKIDAIENNLKQFYLKEITENKSPLNYSNIENNMAQEQYNNEKNYKLGLIIFIASSTQLLERSS